MYSYIRIHQDTYLIGNATENNRKTIYMFYPEMRDEVAARGGCGVGEYVRSCAVVLGDKRCPVSHAVRVRKSVRQVYQNYS